MKSIPLRSSTFFHYDTRRVSKKTSMISHHATSYEMPEQYRGERVIIRYNCQHLYVLNKHKNVIAKYVYSKRKNKTRRRIWYATDKLRTKHRGFEDSLEYRHMPKWLKEIYHHVYEQNPIRFAAFLEQAINHPKDFLKKALKRNGTTIHDLT